MRCRFGALVVSAAAFTVACGGGGGQSSLSTPPTISEAVSTVASTTTTVPVLPVEPLSWQPYAAQPGLEEAWLTVPVDWSAPAGGASFRLHVVRRPAGDPAHRIGSLLVNPGGPGDGGIWLAEKATAMYSAALLARFDIVAWDPRGTGTSTPAIDCIDDYDHFFTGTDITPDTPAEREQVVAVAEEFATACATKNAGIIQQVGTNDSARDMDAIRRAMGEATISYFGWSYGSTLGAVWATLFPATVRAAVLDGAPDPTLNFTEGDLQQSAGFEHTIGTFLAECSADPACAFHNGGHAEEAFDALMQSLDDQPIPTVAGRPPMTRRMALGAVVMAMYTHSWWTNLAGALDDAQHGKGEWLLGFFDRQFQRRDDGTYPNVQEAFETITCMDATDRPTVAEADAMSARFRAVAPRYRPDTVGDYFCSFFPVPDHARITPTAKGAGPILVVGNTDDPSTPLTGARAMAAALDSGVLLTVQAVGHTAYNIDDCARQAIDAYLLQLTVPATGATCS